MISSDSHHVVGSPSSEAPIGHPEVANTHNSPFPKSERVVSQKLIDQLFSKHTSQSAVAFPVRAVFMTRPRPLLEPSSQVLISVSKRHFRHAVDRNRVKRQLREAYRLHKQALTASIPSGQQVLLSLIWLSDDHHPTPQVAHSVATLLQRIARKL